MLAVTGFEEEAIALGNDTDYGLAAAIWTADLNKAVKVHCPARRYRVRQQLGRW